MIISQRKGDRMKQCCCGLFFQETKIKDKVFLQCPNCLFLQKTEILCLDDQKKRYDFHQCDDAYVAYIKKIVEEIYPYLLNGCTLDFGCGKIHALSDILNKIGIESYYYDLFYYPVLPEKQYKNIILVEVFEHLENPFQELKKCFSLLKPDGRIIIKTKSYPEQGLDQWWYLRDTTHISFIVPKTLEIWGNLLGFRLSSQNGDIFVLERI